MVMSRLSLASKMLTANGWISTRISGGEISLPIRSFLWLKLLRFMTINWSSPFKDNLLKINLENKLSLTKVSWSLVSKLQKIESLVKSLRSKESRMKRLLKLAGCSTALNEGNLLKIIAPKWLLVHAKNLRRYLKFTSISTAKNMWRSSLETPRSSLSLKS